MSEVNKRSIRLLVDLQACQTQGSAYRGVGRYTNALFETIFSIRGARDVFFLTSNSLPHQVSLNLASEARVLHLPEMPDWESKRGYRGGERDYLDALLYSTFIAPAKADIVHVSHVFEGLGDRVALPSPALRPSGQIFSATLYDLIPLLFQEHYFQHEDLANWYHSRTAWLRQADLILAISESSRQDAINLLGIEPGRIVTIHGGISPHFLPSNNRADEHKYLSRRYGLCERFVLYTGGDDHRKNIAGAIAGYAEIPKEWRKNCQLVIVCSIQEDSKRKYLNLARTCGLGLEEILFTGFVPEEDLVSFYRTCTVFIFPSLYEGLGLPVLEAMACGAPVVGGNNSSIREIIAREDALFDASSPKLIGESIAKVMRNSDFSNDLRSYGLKRSQEFSWQRSSELAIEAFDEAVRKSRKTGAKAAINGWVPRRRVAMLTPLPPCRSGIADYNAKFLPYLARHFDIDLYVNDYVVSDVSLEAAFRIFDVRNFETVAQSYDVILYEFGNSEFHEHMLSLLEKYPGVVGLHDAYLSGLMRYVEHYKAEPGFFKTEMLAAHGPLANRYLAPIQECADPEDKMTVDLPCSKRILDQAIGVISHSPFNLEVARKFYPEGWQSPYRIIPQMVPVPQYWSSIERYEARKRLGFDKDDFVIASFGHVAWPKWGERLLAAFLSSALQRNANGRLVYVGELAKDQFGSQLNETIVRANLGKRIQITGFLNEKDYDCYLRIADIAVQLRTSSRGGAPKGVLDCLAHGIPVIVNNDASYRDYPDDVVIKIDANPSASMIAAELDKMFEDEILRVSFSDAGRRYVRHTHNPVQCAAEYAAAIHEFVRLDQAALLKNVASKIAPHLGGCVAPAKSSRIASDWLARIQAPAFAKRRLIIDVSYIAKADNQTGVPRVVKQIVKSLYCSARAGFDPLAVELVEGELRPAFVWLLGQKLLPLVSGVSEATQDRSDPITFRAGDVLLMLDSSWARYREFYPVFTEARAQKVPIYTAVYDLLPITLPPGNIVEGGKEWFKGWISDAVSSSDGLVCISKSVANDVLTYMVNTLKPATTPKVGFWHLGSDFSVERDRNAPSKKAVSLPPSPYLLMVGTVEPRKSHALALDALEHLWTKGHELNLCIVGKEGWMVEKLMDRLRRHPLLGKKLFLFEAPSDITINELYERAAGLLFISKAEGFGLPIVEAANHGVPILCSDISVFREIAGDFATYLALDGATSVAVEIESWWKKRESGALPRTREMPRLSWEQSAESLLDVVFNGKWMVKKNEFI